MDFTPRGNRPVPTEQPAQAPVQPVQNAPVQRQHDNKLSGRFDFSKISSVLMLVSTAILAIGVIGLLAFGTPQRNNEQAQFVDTSKYQAVFLNGGQVYFGKIRKFDNNFLVLNDIYYLRVNQQIQPGQQANANDISLAKLGSELHGPEDYMFLNIDEVQFWENLKDDGQVAQAIKNYQANPNQQQQNTTQQNTNNQNQNTTPTENQTENNNNSEDEEANTP